MAEYDRFRSFAERYIIERAGQFRPGFEREDAWNATIDAKTIYQNIALHAKTAEPTEDAVQQAVQQAVHRVGGQGAAQGLWPSPQKLYAAGGAISGQTGPLPQVVSPPPDNTHELLSGWWGSRLSSAVKEYLDAGKPIPEQLKQAVQDHMDKENPACAPHGWRKP